MSTPPQTPTVSTNDAELSQRAMEAMLTLGETRTELFDELVARVAEVLEVDYAFVSEVVDRRRRRIQTRAFWGDGQLLDAVTLDLEGGPCAVVLEQGSYTCERGVADAFPEFSTLRDLGADGYVGVSLSGDEPIGHLCAISTKPIKQLEQKQRLLRAFADRAYQEMCRIREHELLLAQRRVLEMIATNQPLSDVLDRLCRDIERLVRGAVCSVMRRRGDRLSLESGPSIPDDLAAEFEDIAVGRGTCGMAVKTGAPFIVPDTSTDPRWQDLMEYVEKYNIQACWSYPIRINNDRIVGTFAISNSLGGEPTAREYHVLETAAHIAAIAMEREANEVRQALMMNELDHRVKNNLASVMSLAQTTLASAPSLERFAPTFRGRIAAMARTHEALAAQSWQGADLETMIRSTVGMFDNDDADRFVIEGPRTWIPPELASPLGLILHELTTNAAKHGAIVAADGGVHVTWSAPEPGAVELSWVESGSPTATDTDESGVGLRLIEGLARHEMGGDVAFDFEPNGMTCRLRFQGASEAPSEPRATEARPAAGTADPAPTRVLVLEDNYLVAEGLTQMLGETGHVCVGPAGTVDAARTLMTDGAPDLAVLDLNIAGQSSIDLARELRDAGVGLIFVSGYSSPELVPSDLRDAPRLAKPLEAANLAAAIDQACGPAPA